jgi:hypothetical protein
MRFLFHSDLARIMLTLHRDLDHAHADTDMSKRQLTPALKAIFFFWYFPSPPKKGGGVGWGRAQQQQQKSAAATAATVALQGQNEINTAMTRNRLRACEVVVF